MCFFRETETIECYSYPGRISTDFPKLELTLGELTVFIHPQSYLKMKRFDQATGFTIYIVQMQGAYVSQWLLGTPFLKNYYTIFDTDEMQIGLVGMTYDISLD